MWHHFHKAPAFISIDNYKEYGSYIPIDESMLNTFTKNDLEKEIGIILGGMVAEDEISGLDSKTVGASHDLSQATQKAKKMVVEYGFGDNIKNTSLIEVQDYAMISGKEILEDIQKILDSAKEETEEILSANREVLDALVKKLCKDVLMNNDTLVRFFRDHPLASEEEGG